MNDDLARSVLGVSKNCEPRDVHRAFRTRARPVHPDKTVRDSPASRQQKETEFKQLANARDQLLKSPPPAAKRTCRRPESAPKTKDTNGQHPYGAPGPNDRGGAKAKDAKTFRPRNSKRPSASWSKLASRKAARQRKEDTKRKVS
mmetsp:Transcript_89487/g.255584  ORF Transcript_89487/g.255584 Transcript_89487/m.255584 type:complete len:145 (-) Transcript_89487:443-877(-)